MLSIYCDGSSCGRVSKPGGYGWIVVKNEEVVLWGYGGSPSTTNNLQELEAAIQGLQAVLATGLNVGDAVELVCDSQYVLGMVTRAYHPTSNLGEVAKLRQIADQIKGLRCRWVKGHSGDKWNEKADELADQGKLENTPLELRKKPKVKSARTIRREEQKALLDKAKATL